MDKYIPDSVCFHALLGTVALFLIFLFGASYIVGLIVMTKWLIKWLGGI